MTLRTRLRAQTGQTMTEYAVALALITPAIVLLFGTLSSVTKATIMRVVDLIP
jgi:Flp pilus assembly pilin Flp